MKGEFITSQNGQRTAARVQRLQNISDPTFLTEEFHFADLLHGNCCGMMRPRMQCVLESVGMSEGIASALILKLNSVNIEPLSLHQLSYWMDKCTVVIAEASLRSATLFEGPVCRQHNQAEVF